MIYTLTSWLMFAHRCIFQSPEHISTGTCPLLLGILICDRAKEYLPSAHQGIRGCIAVVVRYSEYLVRRDPLETLAFGMSLRHTINFCRLYDPRATAVRCYARQ